MSTLVAGIPRTTTFLSRSFSYKNDLLGNTTILVLGALTRRLNTFQINLVAAANANLQNLGFDENCLHMQVDFRVADTVAKKHAWKSFL